MSFTGNLLKGVATYLAAGGVGVYQPNGTYPAGTDSAIFLGDMPGSPDRLIVLTAYPVDDAPALSDSTVGLQVRTRGVPSSAGSVDTLDDAVFDRLHGVHGLTVGGVRIVQAHRRSGASMGIDGNRRHGRTSNYYLTVHRPSQHRS